MAHCGRYAKTLKTMNRKFARRSLCLSLPLMMGMLAAPTLQAQKIEIEPQTLANPDNEPAPVFPVPSER